LSHILAAIYVKKV